MSTLRVEAITDIAGNNPSTTLQLQQGRAKSWLNMNGTGTIAARDSFNVSSLVDNGTGDYSANLATAHANANYDFTMTSGGTPSAGFFRTYEDVRPRTTVQVSFITANTSATLIDTSQISTQTLGD